MQKSKKADKKDRGKKHEPNKEAPMHHVDITTESPTSRTGGGPMKEDKTARGAGGNRQQQDSGDKEDSMGSGKRQDDL